MKEAVEFLSIIASAIFGKQYGTSKKRDESPDAWFDFYFNLIENTWNKYQMLITTMSFLMLDNRRTSTNPNLEKETRSSLESQDSTLLYQTSRIEPPTKCSTPLHTETNEEWFTKRDKIEAQSKSNNLMTETTPTAPRNDKSTFLEPSRHVRFSPDSFDTQERRQLEMYNPHPILFVSPPEKFDPKKTDVRQSVKDFDMFIESNNISSRKINIVLAHLDHETRRIIENNQFSLHEETAYKELKTLLIQLYGKKATSNLELKRQFTERVQNQYENVHLYASQLKILAKQSHPELLQYQKDDLIKEQFIRGLRDKKLRTNLQMIREESSLEDIIDEAARYEKAVSDVREFPERSKKVEFEE
ncbi:unnamed protein product, partial [Brachionus calyciflorus]